MGSSAPYLIDRGDVQNSGNSRRAGEDRGLGRVVAIRSNANERLLLSDASIASNGRNEGAMLPTGPSAPNVRLDS